MAELLIIDGDPLLGADYGRFLERGGHAVRTVCTGADGIAEFRQRRPDAVLMGVQLPDMSGFEVHARIRDEAPIVIMLSTFNDPALGVRALQEGIESFLGGPLELTRVGVAVGRALDTLRLRQLSRHLAVRRIEAGMLAIGRSCRMRDLALQVEGLAARDRTTVLLAGECGVGKRRVAALIHALSPRSHAPFVDVSCQASDAEALAAALFGVEENRRGPGQPGLWEIAAGGSLLLDEVGQLPASVQSLVLRTLEGRAVPRIGGARQRAVDVRVIATSSGDLVNEVNAGRFREDLYYRLSVMPLSLPPLRARSPYDLEELIDQLMRELAQEIPDAPRALSVKARGSMARYAWPGNIREMQNVLERAMLLARGLPSVRSHLLPPEVRGDASDRVARDPGGRSLADIERSHIEHLLHAHDGNRTRAARDLGIARATLIKKIKTYGLLAAVE
ncbi:MAG: sigma-54 dependent transcriptional regulator [Gemmatimonadaceae bacterium]